MLAQKVLQNQTRGYRNHPQLRRFKSSPDANGAISMYLRGIYTEALDRGYHFSEGKIGQTEFNSQIPCTQGQLLYEWEHLRQKLMIRDATRYREIESLQVPMPHPLFNIIEGDVEEWEIKKSNIFMNRSL